MSQTNFNKNKIKELIDESSNIGVIPSKISGLDSFCAAVALFHLLDSNGKNAKFIYSGKVPQEAEGLIKDEDVLEDVKERSLHVNIDYSDTQASKVHYSTDDGVLSLRISPVSFDFDKEKRVSSKVSGFEFDLLIVVGAQNKTDLGGVYKNLDSDSKLSKIINIDNTSKNERFGSINIVDPDINSISLLLFNRLPYWGLDTNEKVAKALLKGIVYRKERLNS